MRQTTNSARDHDTQRVDAGQRKVRWAGSMLVVLFGMGAIAGSTAAATMAAALPKVAIGGSGPAQPTPGEHSHERTMQPLGAAEVALVPIEFTQGRSGQRMKLRGTLAFSTVQADASEQVRYRCSFGLFDSNHEAFLPPRPTPMALVDKREGGALDLEVPEGLPDGYYYADLICAWKDDVNQPGPAIHSSRLYLRVQNGEVEPTDPASWWIVSGNWDGRVEETTEKAQP